MTMQGRRLPDQQWPKIFSENVQPGDFWKVLGQPGDENGWHICTPNNHIGNIGRHVVEEHEDGMITVKEQPEANSILVTKGPGEDLWHGYIRHGVWDHV